jgi:predicted RNA-binding protein (virulence factor B family)
MVQIGRYNHLKIIEITEKCAYLDGGDGEIELARRSLPEGLEAGQSLEVFVYCDSDDFLVATTEKPYAQVGEFALLKVVSSEKIGAFLNWGLPKDLFLPFAEQTGELQIGDEVLVRIYLDNSERIAASMRIEKFLDKKTAPFKEGEKVDLILFDTTELGLKAIINQTHLGILYKNEIFQTLEYGQKVSGYIKKVREDKKIDLALVPAGVKAAPDIGQKILDKITADGGFMQITDKTDPQIIYDLFGVSKKKYKMALGALYKKRLVVVEDQGVRLAPKKD